MNNEQSKDPSTQRFDLQKTLFEKGFEQTQKQIQHLDEILFKIKASAITVWVALMGWAISNSKPGIIPLGIIVIIGFWLLESIFKGAQIRYIETSVKLMRMVNDTDSLQHQFEIQRFNDELIYPLALNLKERDRLILMGRGLISPTIATAYLFLAFANTLVWLTIGR
jgi:hypothetical protein